jgi:mono/diheme cytochrome c family protein
VQSIATAVPESDMNANAFRSTARSTHASRAFRLGTLSVALGLLAACGGGSDAGSTSNAANSPLTVSTNAQGLSIRLANSSTEASASTAVASTSSASTPTTTSSPTSGAATQPAMAWSSQQFSFSASVNSGPDAGRSLSGTLVLNGERDDESTGNGVTEVEGRLLLSTAGASATPTASASELRRQYRTAVHDRVDQLRAELGTISGRLSEAQRSTIQSFRADLRQLNQDYQTRIEAAVQQQRAQRSSSYQVLGVIEADGSVSLKLSGRDGKLRFSGQLDASGNLSGTFTGPTSGDAGSWQATVQSEGTGTSGGSSSSSGSGSGSGTSSGSGSTSEGSTGGTGTTGGTSGGSTSGGSTGGSSGSTSGSTSGGTSGSTSGGTTGGTTGGGTSTTPTGNATNGQARYSSSCSGCHTSNPAANANKILKGATLAGVNTAMSKAVHSGFASTLTTQDRMDLAAYLAGFTTPTPTPTPTPAPTPAPATGDIAAGQAKYGTICFACHTTNVAANVMSITKAATLTGITAAMKKSAHSGFSASLTNADLLNLSAYINSAK